MPKFFVDKQGRVRKINDNDLEMFKQMEEGSGMFSKLTPEEITKLQRRRVRKINDTEVDLAGITMELEVNRAKRAGVSKRELFERDVFDRKLGSLSDEDRDVVMLGIGTGRIQIGDIVEGSTKKTVSSAKALDDALENISAARALRLNPEAKRQFIKENALRRSR